MPSSVILLGSTGSIGVSSLRVIKSLGDEFRVRGLSCHRNLELLGKQIREFAPEAVAVGDDSLLGSPRYAALRRENPGVRFLEGPGGIEALAGLGADIVISAIVGAAGLRPSMRAAASAGRIAIANKETLVMAGEIFTAEVRRHGAQLIPVDSEHCAIFSLLSNLKREEVRRIILTASGGSLRETPAEEMEGITPEQALSHPTWSMGSKITIDSATLMNKGLEVIEAHHLFGIDYDDIEIIIHPESVVHSMVETTDGGLFAFMSVPDMALPILSALTYPEKRANDFGRLDLARLGVLSFRAHDAKRFPALALCYEAGRAGGTMPAVLNGANEAAVGAFLAHEIKFTDIVKIVETTMGRHTLIPEPGIEDIFAADAWARETAHELMRG